MKRKMIGMLLAVSVLFSSITVSAADTGKPWMYSGLEGSMTLETEVSLKDDYAAAINKDWILSTEILDGYSYYSRLVEKAYDMPDELIAILEDDSLSDDPNAQITQGIYNMWLDWDTRNALGMSPAMPYLNEIRAIQTMDDLKDYLLVEGGVNSYTYLFGLGVDTDLGNAKEYAVYISAPSLLLGDSAEYFEPTEYGLMEKTLLSELLEKLFVKTGMSQEQAKQIIEDCFTFETMLAESLPSFEEKAKPDYLDKMYNPCTMDFIKEHQDNLPIAEIMEVNGFDKASTIILSEPEWFEAFKGIYKQENLTLIKNYMLSHTMVSVASMLDRECYDWVIEVNNAISGAEGTRSDEEMASQFVSGMLGMPLAQLYCEKYYTEEDKAKIEAVCYDVIDEYKEMIRAEDFLTEATKQTAIDKLNHMTVRAIYPDKWDDYSAITYEHIKKSGNLVDAAMMVAYYESLVQLNQIGKEIDKERWFVIPTECNAYYNPQDNSINILAGILGDSVYRNDMSIEEIYAGVGCVIGHEISHGFDPTGSQFDRDGNFSDWWTETDRAAYNQKTEKLIAYYNQIQPWEGTNFDGSILQGEAIADLGGVACILRMAKKIDGFNYDKFFRAYAGVWAQVTSKQWAVYTAMYDTHPANYLRINVTLAQFDEFQQTYGITEGDGMYVRPEDRITVW